MFQSSCLKQRQLHTPLGLPLCKEAHLDASSHGLPSSYWLEPVEPCSLTQCSLRWPETVEETPAPRPFLGLETGKPHLEEALVASKLSVQ